MTGLTSKYDARSRRVAISTAAAFLLLGAGCTQFNDIHNPTTSPLELGSESIPELNSVSVPMPERAPFVAPQRAEAAGLWGNGTRSFFDDKRAQAVGDILTVVIDIDDEAQLRNASERSRSSTQVAADPTLLGYDVLAGVQAVGATSPGDVVNLDSSSDATGNGSIKRNESIQLRVAAMIVQTLPNGNLVIAGRQEVKVNSELRELRIAGIARPEDVSLRNTVKYDKIAEARITYGGRGQISAIQRPRYGHDALEVILPY